MKAGGKDALIDVQFALNVPGDFSPAECDTFTKGILSIINAAIVGAHDADQLIGALSLNLHVACLGAAAARFTSLSPEAADYVRRNIKEQLAEFMGMLDQPELLVWRADQKEAAE